MITCKPKGLFSSDYILTAGRDSAVVTFNRLSEQGSIRINGQTYNIDKPSMFRGTWNLLGPTGVMASANKTSVFSRKIDITIGNDTFRLSPNSIFGRSMKLVGPNARVKITPHMLFSRRAKMTGNLPPFLYSCFVFWLTSMLWKRAANRTNTDDSSHVSSSHA